MQFEQRAAALKERKDALKEAGTLRQMSEGPALLDEAVDFIVEIAAKVDALTPYLDEGAT